MNKSISKLSRLPRAITLKNAPGTQPHDGQPSCGCLISKGTSPSQPHRRGPGMTYFRVRLPVAQQLLFLNLPAVRRHIAWRERVAAVRVALALVGTGKFSQATVAPVVGMSQGALCKWLNRFRAFGEDGLLEKRKGTIAATKQGAGEVVCKLSFYKCP